jgi:hypothetical protein
MGHKSGIVVPGQEQLLVQPVDRPILCSPYEEPRDHWVYEKETGAASRAGTRRPASYWYKTERTGSAQLTLTGLAEEERDDLPRSTLCGRPFGSGVRLVIRARRMSRAIYFGIGRGQTGDGGCSSARWKLLRRSSLLEIRFPGKVGIRGNQSSARRTSDVCWRGNARHSAIQRRTSFRA